MARKRSNKIEPSAMKIFLPIPSWDGINQESAKWYADINQIKSLVNRRFYRQGTNVAIAGITLHTPGFANSGTPFYIQPNTTFTISRLPNSWVFGNSWVKGMRAWNRMNKEALEESPSVRPRFLDFKIFANSTHHGKGIGANLLPIQCTPGEWFSSKAVIPVAAGATEGAINEFEFVGVGANFPGPGFSGLNAISLIEGYANSRGLPQPEDPNVPDDAADADDNTPENWLAAMFNDGTQQTDEVLDVMINQNNQAPYPFENDGIHLDTMYPGGENQMSYLEIAGYSTVTQTTIGGTTRFSGFNAPCGLLEFQNNIRYYQNPDLSGVNEYYSSSFPSRRWYRGERERLQRIFRPSRTRVSGKTKRRDRIFTPESMKRKISYEP